MKLHWYSFSFNYVGASSHGFGNTYVGFSEKDQITKAIIETQKKAACPNVEPENVVLITVSYLGYMEKDNFVNLA